MFAVVVIGFVYGLLFVSQPMEQAPNDKEFISLMATIVTFLSGTLAGIVLLLFLLSIYANYSLILDQWHLYVPKGCLIMDAGLRCCAG